MRGYQVIQQNRKYAVLITSVVPVIWPCQHYKVHGYIGSNRIFSTFYGVLTSLNEKNIRFQIANNQIDNTLKLLFAGTIQWKMKMRPGDIQNITPIFAVTLLTRINSVPSKVQPCSVPTRI